MFVPLLRLREPADIEEHNRLTDEISECLLEVSIYKCASAGGVLGGDLRALERHLNEELRAFRVTLFETAHAAAAERGTDGVLHYAFPEETVLPNVGDRCYSPSPHAEIHEEELEFLWHPNLPANAYTQAMQVLQRKVERSQYGIQVRASDVCLEVTFI